MLILTRRPAGLRLSLIRISDGLPTLSWPMARKVPVPCALSYIRRYGMYGIYTPRWRENAVDAVTIHYSFLCKCSRRGFAFYPAKVPHVSWTASVFIRNTSEIFLSEQALKAYFRHFQHKPSECRAADVAFCAQRKKQFPDGWSKAPEQKGNK